MKKLSLIVLSSIFLLSLFLRLWNLDTLPPALHRDEAFLGYNAYSLLKTGKDMTGDFLPIHLRSFLYSPAGYSYFAIPGMLIFGLNAFSTRLPSALFGSFTVVGIYLLTKQLLKNSKYKEYVALLSSFFLAIMPWHITLSRVATENVLVTFFLVLGVWLYILWLRKRNWFFCIFSFFSFIVTIGIYQAPRAFLPLFMPVLFILYLKQLGRKRFVVSVVMFFLAIIIPVVLILASPQLSLRIKTLSITQNGDAPLILGEQAHQEAGAVPLLVTRIFHNKMVFYGGEFIQNYFLHFSYDFLFTDKGLPDRYRVPLTGLLYVWELPLILLGLWMMVQKEKTSAFLLLAWTLLTPVGSALTSDDIPNLQRTLFMIIPLCIFLSYGTTYIYSTLWKKSLRIAYICLLAALSIFAISFYVLQYSVHEPLYRPWFRMDGYRELVAQVNKLLPNYKKAIITNRESAPAIFFLFYMQYNPEKFQKETKNTTMHDFDRIGFGNYEFSQEECPLRKSLYKLHNDGTTQFLGDKDALYVDSGLCWSNKPDENQLPDTARIIKNIKRHDNSSVFLISAIK